MAQPAGDPSAKTPEPLPRAPASPGEAWELRRTWLIAAGAAVIFVTRSPIGGPDSVWWWSFWGIALLLSVTAAVARRQWIYFPPIAIFAFLALKAHKSHDLADWIFTLYLFLSLPHPPGLRQKPFIRVGTATVTHHQVRLLGHGTALAFVAELVPLSFRTMVRGLRQREWWWPTGVPWADFLLFCGAVLVATLVVAWVSNAVLARTQLREARDHAMRLKLAPHFIFNTLNTVKAQLERDPRDGAATIDRLAALYRQLLERADQPTVPLRDELAFVEAYLGIERSRFGERLQVTVEVPESLESLEIPTLGLQVLVENAIQHGIAPREEGGEVRIRAWLYDDATRKYLCVAVENPAAPAGTRGTGTGLDTLRARLRSPGDLRLEERNGRIHAQFQWWVHAVGA